MESRRRVHPLRVGGVISENASNVPWRRKSYAPDGPRYKVLGNSMAVNCMRWLGARLATIDAAANHSYHFTDALGSVVALANASGQLTEKHAYGAYGLATSTTGTGYQFASRRVDSETALYYNCARNFSADAAVNFSTMVPDALQGGDYERYSAQSGLAAE